MNQTTKIHWTITDSWISILFTLLVLILGHLLFVGHMVSFFWILPGFLTVVLFFFGFNFFIHTWKNYSEKKFINRLFWTSCFIRSFVVAILYLVFYKLNGNPFEFHAADSLTYHSLGQILAQSFKQGNFNIKEVLGFYHYDFSDFGYPTVVGSVYYLFGPYTIAVRLLNIIVGSFTVILIYKLSRAFLDQTTARIAAVLTMMFPYLLYYTGLTLKETVMIFIIVYAIYYSVKLVHHQDHSLTTILILTSSLLSLFFFRSFLAALVLISFATYLLLYKSKSQRLRMATLLLGIVVVMSMIFGIDRIGLRDEINSAHEYAHRGMVTELATKTEELGSGVDLKKIVAAPVFFLF